jgi:VID27 C-terminal WD40-like domain
LNRAERSASEGEPEDEDEDGLPSELANGGRNSQLTVGYKGDRAYVVRGNNIGVFRHSGDNQVKYYATISKIANTKGREFSPKKVTILLFLPRCMHGTEQ